MLESDLVKRCKKSDRKAQEQLYAKYADRLFRLAMRYIRNTADTEDVMITAFTKVFTNISRFTYRGEGSLEAWIRAIVVNESLMWLRRRHNFNLTESMGDNVASLEADPIDNLPAEDIYQFIIQLPIGYRTVFNLFVVEGFEHAEIANLLGISESTSRTQLYKGRALLKKMLTAEGFQYGT